MGFDPITLSLAAKAAMRAMGADVVTEDAIILGGTTADEGVYAADPDSGGTLKEGCVYTVWWDDSTYVRTCKSMTLEGETGVYLGNMSMLGLEDTGEPFAIFDVDSQGVGAIAIDGGLHVFMLTQKTETIHPIDPKFIPGPNLIDCAEYGINPFGSSQTLEVTDELAEKFRNAVLSRNCGMRYIAGNPETEGSDYTFICTTPLVQQGGYYMIGPYYPTGMWLVGLDGNSLMCQWPETETSASEVAEQWQ